MSFQNKHPSYGNRPIPSLQLYSTLAKFNGQSLTSKYNLEGAGLSNLSSGVNQMSISNNNNNNLNMNTNYQDNNQYTNQYNNQYNNNQYNNNQYNNNQYNNNQNNNQYEDHRYDPSYNSNQSNNNTFTTPAQSTRPYSAAATRGVVGNLLGKQDENIIIQENSLPSKRRIEPQYKPQGTSLIGGQTDNDPYRTTSQRMNEGESSLNNKSTKKKLYNNNVKTYSPITGTTSSYIQPNIQPNPNNKGNSEVNNTEFTENSPVLDRLRKIIESRGSKGIIGLSRIFKIMDDDGSKTLSFDEFKKAMKEFNMGLSDAEVLLLFKKFDYTNLGVISYNNFLTTIGGKLNDRRKKLIHMAFNILDEDKSGVVTLEEIALKYDTSKHPEVLTGKKTSEEVLTEFIKVFEVGGVIDGNVTLDEFENYYRGISAGIDNDDYFELMIRNSWRISGGEGAAANTANLRVLVTHADGSQTVEEVKNSLGLDPRNKTEITKRLNSQGISSVTVDTTGGTEENKGRRSFSSPAGNGNPYNLSVGPSPNFSAPPPPTQSKPKQARPSTSNRSRQLSSVDNVNHPTAPSPGLQLLIEKLKKEFKARGTGNNISLLNLKRRFKIMDDDGSGNLCFNEFKKALKEFAWEYTDNDYRALFDYFDRDSSGTISYEEFIYGVRDKLKENRLNLVLQAFNLLDTSGDGIISFDEIASKYDCSKHPDVLSGKKTPQKVYHEFMSTFEDSKTADGKITKEEFIDYYTNLSVGIENDDYFELMMRNSWHISGGENSAANSSNLRVLVTRSDGTENTITILNDLGLKKDDISAIYSRLLSQGESDIFAINGKVIRKVNINGVDVITTSGHTSALNNPPPGSKLVVPKLVEKATPFSYNQSSQQYQQNKTINMTNYNKKNFPVSTSKDISIHPRDLDQSYNVSKKNIVGETLLGVLRTQLINSGVDNLVEFQRTFSDFDKDNSKTISYHEFNEILKNFSIVFSDDQIVALFKYMDKDLSNEIDYEEFLEAIRGPIPSQLLYICHAIFDRLDPENKGSLTPSELISKYSPDNHPQVISGEYDRQVILNKLLDTLDVGESIAGRITRDEFIKYYHTIYISSKEPIEQFIEELSCLWNVDSSLVNSNRSNSTRNNRLNSAKNFAENYWEKKNNNINNNINKNTRPQSSSAIYRGSTSNSSRSNSVQNHPFVRSNTFTATSNNIFNTDLKVQNNLQVFGSSAAVQKEEDQNIPNEVKIENMIQEGILKINEGESDKALLILSNALALAQIVYPPCHSVPVKIEQVIEIAKRRDKTRGRR